VPNCPVLLCTFISCAVLKSMLAMAAAENTEVAALVPVRVRVHGLALGSTLGIRQGGTTVAVTLNDEYMIGAAAEANTALDLQLTSQPAGQQCAISELAPSLVPADSAPIFVRCRSLPAPTLQMPLTLPNQPLAVMLASSAVRPVAYPGIAYESRPGVLGGIFPYEFRLQSVSFNNIPQSLSTVSIDFRTGGMRFVPSAEGAYSINVEIRDSGNPQKQLVHTFSIEVAASRFVFVGINGVDDLAHGSLASPYRTLAYALTRTTSNQVIVFRKGTYPIDGFAVDDAHAKQFIAYPDEAVVLDLNYSGWVSVNTTQLPAARFENLDFTRVQQYGIFSDPSTSGLVIRQVRFRDGREGLTPSENPAFIHGYGDSAPLSRHRFLFQDNDFGTFVMNSSGAFAMTFFDVGESLIENNQLRLGATTGGIHDKDNSQRNTYRENYIEFSTQNANNNGFQVSAQANSDSVHIHHNLLINSGIRIGLQCFQETCYMRDHDLHHNTIDGAGIVFGWGAFNSGSFGTRVSHNLVRSSSAPYAWHSCLSAVPTAFATQLVARSNRFETSNALAMLDDECGGSAMNMSWTIWRDTRGMDTSASGSVLSATSDLVGAGPTLGLPGADPRRTLYGHLFPLTTLNPQVLFVDGFE
jgi:hypothetical protein